MSYSQLEFFKVLAVVLYSITFNFIFLAILFKIEDFLGYKPLLSMWFCLFLSWYCVLILNRVIRLAGRIE